MCFFLLNFGYIFFLASGVRSAFRKYCARRDMAVMAAVQLGLSQLVPTRQPYSGHLTTAFRPISIVRDWIVLRLAFHGRFFVGFYPGYWVLLGFLAFDKFSKGSNGVSQGFTGSNQI